MSEPQYLKTQRRDAGHPAQANSRPEGMLWIEGGTFLMGSDHHYAEEAPVQRVAVDGFWIDRHIVTNDAFRRFVQATGYLTLAERAANAADYPNAKPELLMPASVVFQKPRTRVDLGDCY